MVSRHVLAELVNRLLAVGPRRTLPRTQAYVVILGWKQVQVQDTLFQVHEGPQELKKKKKEGPQDFHTNPPEI